jgi:hypothetical protein
LMKIAKFSHWSCVSDWSFWGAWSLFVACSNKQIAIVCLWLLSRLMLLVVVGLDIFWAHCNGHWVKRQEFSDCCSRGSPFTALTTVRLTAVTIVTPKESRQQFWIIHDWIFFPSCSFFEPPKFPAPFHLPEVAGTAQATRCNWLWPDALWEMVRTTCVNQHHLLQPQKQWYWLDS